MTLKMEAEVPDEMEGVRYQSRWGILAGRRLISREVDAANRAKRGETSTNELDHRKGRSDQIGRKRSGGGATVEKNGRENAARQTKGRN